MDELTKTKIDNLISLRQLIVQVLVVLIGGSIGLLFTTNTLLKWGLFVIGAIYVILLAKKLNKISNELKSYLYKKEN